MLRNTALLALIATVAASNLRERSYYEEKFVNWMSEHKVAARDGDHFVHMLKNYIANDQLIEETNSKNLSYKLGHNKFSHMNREEWSAFVRQGGLQKMPENVEGAKLSADDCKNYADSINWVEKGAVTSVKDQGSCGSCWSFSATGALEGAYYLKHGKIVSFSEQEFVDCDDKDSACNGGLMVRAFSWAKSNGALSTEAEYPYVSGTTKRKGTCTKTDSVDFSLEATTLVAKDSVECLKSALTDRPVSVSIEADQATFQLYKSGVFDGTCGDELDHGVLAVGYGVENGAEYWLVKNSWGSSWGEAGYIKLAINVNSASGQCGILSGPPVYPNMD